MNERDFIYIHRNTHLIFVPKCVVLGREAEKKEDFSRVLAIVTHSRGVEESNYDWNAFGSHANLC